MTVTFDPISATEWQIGARFGVEYVLDQMSLRTVFPHGATIRVSRVVGHIVDTNNALIAYLAALALIDALGVVVQDVPELDVDNGLVVFPK